MWKICLEIGIQKVYFFKICRTFQIEGHYTFGTWEVLGPEHEFSIVDENLRPLPIVDEVIKGLHGRIVNYVRLDSFTFGKELQAHVAEFKANMPFSSPETFEETMHEAVLKISDFLETKYGAHLLGLGMHPFLKVEDVKVWSHRDKSIYKALSRIFNFSQHGWLNIQSFQLNLSYCNERKAMELYNALANILPYIPAISAASPIYESKIGEFVDNRLHFYQVNQKEIPSITGDIIPEYINSFDEYLKVTINRYSQDLMRLNAPKCIVNKEWINSRGAVFRFDRKAIEIRIMDEQECIKSDVALSCFIRALLRGLTQRNDSYLPYSLLARDLNAVIKDGLDAKVQHPKASTAREVCRYFYKIAEENATQEEKEYLRIVKKRIEEGNLSNIILKNVINRSQKTDLKEAIFGVYLSLLRNLTENKIYS